MFVFGKVWRTLFSCYLRFEIHPFDILPTITNTTGSYHLYSRICQKQDLNVRRNT